ncbi:hypothetical protein PMG11_00804 [Penicillium brasilianum]|uniref:Uncharacterized protein n=1 Tax=Penicillium brasilianum TaxID=104259 RepID=A0A0F7TG77_PENBI|nr:hypothetical protein PMG11_00804 [Penicillium brasilianum]
MADSSSSPCKIIEPNASFLERLDDETWLLIILANFDDCHKDHLVECLRSLANVPMTEHEASGEDGIHSKRFKKRTVASWEPSSSLLRSLATQGPYRDSQANLYALAVLAHQYGHPEFIVADDLSRRQMNPATDTGSDGEPLNARNLNFEVILVSVFEDEVTSTDIHVWARRVSIQSDGRVRQWGEWPVKGDLPMAQMFAESHEAWNWQTVAVPNECREFGNSRLTPSGPEFEDQIWMHNGLGIRDPDCSILTPGVARTLGHKSRLIDKRNTIGKLLPSLPTELVYDIVDLVEISVPVRLPIWQNPPSERHLVIFVSFSMTPKQRQEAERDIRIGIQVGDNTPSESPCQPDSQMTFELIPLERHGATSRRDFMNLWAEYFTSTVMFQKRDHLPPLHILSEPITDISNLHFIEILGDNKSVALASRTSISRIVEITREYGNNPYQRWFEIHVPDDDEGSRENLCQPEQPFYRTRFSWQSPSTLHTEDPWLPIFYLTSQLTDDQDLQIRSKIERPEPPEDENGDTESDLTGCGFMPWPRGKCDGTIRDIWNIVQHVHKESLWRDDDWFFCIDQQTAIDKKFIFVVPDRRKVRHRRRRRKHLYLPDLAGFTYSRIPCSRAYSVWLEIQVLGTRSLQPLKWERFLRPELLRVDRMTKNDEYPYVDGDGKRFELPEDVDSEGSPSPSASSSEDEENEGVLCPLISDNL